MLRFFPTRAQCHPRVPAKLRDLFLRVRQALVVGAILVWVPVIHAQVTTADLLGAVTDSTGAAVPGATVTIRQNETAAERSATTDDRGNYLFTLLPVGHYSVRVEHAGFKSWTNPNVHLALADRQRVDVRLDIGELSQSVEVTGQPPALQTDTATIGALVDQRAVEDLPLNGRNFVSLVQLTAGATDYTGGSYSTGNNPDDRRRSSTVAVNGQTGAFNNFLIDGLDDNERFIGTVIVKPSVEGLQEMKVDTNAYSAELGRTGGGVINLITKSGTNQFHGSAYEFFRNQHLDARNFFAIMKPAYRQNEPGGSIGGPIKKDRTFFFGDFESFRYTQGQTYASTVPTLAMRQGNFAGIAAVFDPLSAIPNPAVPGGYIRTRFANDQIPASRLDPVGVSLVNLYPAPTSGGLANNFTLSPNKLQIDNDFDIRVDHKISDRDSMFVRYSYNNVYTLIPGAFPVAPNGIDPVGNQNFSGTAKETAHGAQINYTHIIGPRTVMELKGGYSRLGIFSLPTDYGQSSAQQMGLTGINVDADSSGLPVISPSGYTGMGDATYIPEITLNNLFQIAGSVSYNPGAHSIKVGMEFRRRQVYEHQSATPKGSFSFDGNLTNDPSGSLPGSGNSIASLLLGYPASTSRSKYLVYPGYRLLETGAFVQDDWRATHWLTLNLGLRYDYFSPISEEYNRISNVDLSTGGIVIAGQNGISNTAGVQKDWLNLAPRFGFAATIDSKTVVRGGFGTSFVPPIMGSPYAFRNPPFSNLLTITASATTPANKLSNGLPFPTPVDPANPTGSLNAVAFNLQNQYLMQYNLVVERELPSNVSVSLGYVAALGRKMTSTGGPDMNRPYPGPGAINPRRPFYSLLPGVSAISVLRGWGNTDYQSMQITVERRFQKNFGVLSTYTWAHSIDNFQYRIPAPGVPQQPKENAAGDIRHRFTLSGNYQLPWGKNVGGFGGAVARGWQLNAIMVLQTGLPFTVTNATARSNTGSTDLPNVIGNPYLSSGQRTVPHWFNTLAFQAQQQFTFGSEGYNAIYGPGKFNLDFSVNRTIPIRERLQLQLRGEAFNLTNTPAFGNPGSALGSSTFGVISSAGLPRNIQVAVKLTF